MKTTRSVCASIGVSLAVSACMPGMAYAAVSISEIMYDPVGSDTGREWLEFTNNGSSGVDISGYKLFEANTNHGLTLLSGTGTLGAGASAVIVEDQTKFMADFPQYTGALFKASFSLNNSGEALAIKDSIATIVDSVSYDPTVGAGGDGNSLVRSGSGFVVSAPTPGTSGTATALVSTASATSTTTTSATTATETETTVNAGNGPPPLSAQITVAPEAIVGAGTLFTAQAYDETKKVQSSVRYIWNFGDGSTAEGQTVLHTYVYPGSYVVVLTVAAGYSDGEASYTLRAVPANLAMVLQTDTSQLIVNHWSHALDIGGWVLACPGNATNSNFIIPKRTTVLGGGGVRFTAAVTGLSCGIQMQLMYPNGTLALQSELADSAPEHGEQVAPSAMAKLQQGVAALVAPAVAPAAALPPAVTPNLVQISTKNNTEAVSQKTAAKTPAAKIASTSSSTQTAGVANSGAHLPVSESALGLVALVMLGAAGARYAAINKQKAAAPEETYPTADEFDIE